MISIIRFILSLPFLFLAIVFMSIYCLVAGREATQAMIDTLDKTRKT